MLDELKNMDPQWPVLDDEEMEKLSASRELLVSQTELREKKPETGKKLKPSDTAIGIALKSDRETAAEEESVTE